MTTTIQALRKREGALGEGTHSHVLNGKERAISAQEHVEVARPDDGVVRVLDYTGKDAILSRTETSVVDGTIALPEDAVVALGPVSAYRRVDGGLHV